MNSEQKCIICFKQDFYLVKVSETDCNNIKWIYKLSLCVPEVEWNEDHCLCTTCIGQLDIAYTFRDLCLQSVTQRKEVDEWKCETFEMTELKCEVFVCFHCNQPFHRKLLLISHIRSQHRGNKVPCSYCHSLHDGKSDGCKIKEKFRCNGCNMLFISQTDLFHHSVGCAFSVEGQQQELLASCVAGTPQEEDLPKRGRKRLASVSNTCNICGMTFNTRYLAKRHIRNVHATEKNYQCEICEQRFASPVYLNAHKRYHSGERSHICSFCGKGFITGSDLYHHEKIHANKRAYKCDKCPKAFNTSSDLYKHKLCVHQDKNKWKYVCPYCNRRFPLKTNFDAHIKTHTGERNFACHLCNHKCVSRSVLLRHITSHSNIRLFKCSLCSIEYKYQKSLDIHMKKVHGIGNVKIPERVKKYFCHICPKSYFANDKLQKHIRTHTGERPFSCHICEKRFIDKSYVKQHLKTAHNVRFNNVGAIL